MGDHSLKDCPAIRDKINKNKNVNVLSRVQKCDIIHTNNLHVVTRQGTKMSNDNPRISKIQRKDYYPNPIKQKQLYNDASDMFQDFARQEAVNDRQQNTLKELFILVQNDKSISQFIDLLYNMNHRNNTKNRLKIYAV